MVSTPRPLHTATLTSVAIHTACMYMYGYRVASFPGSTPQLLIKKLGGGGGGGVEPGNEASYRVERRLEESWVSMQEANEVDSRNCVNC